MVIGSLFRLQMHAGLYSKSSKRCDPVIFLREKCKGREGERRKRVIGRSRSPPVDTDTCF